MRIWNPIRIEEFDPWKREGRNAVIGMRADPGGCTGDERRMYIIQIWMNKGWTSMEREKGLKLQECQRCPCLVPALSTVSCRAVPLLRLGWHGERGGGGGVLWGWS